MRGWRLAFFALCVPVACLSQRVTGEIVGSVEDASHAMVPGAKVAITEQGTKASRSVVADASGFYRAPTLEIGRYTVEASAPGFKTTVRRDLELHVNEVLRVDVALEVGAVTEQIAVEATAPVIATETGEISNIVGTRQVQDLPLNGRIFTQLAFS